MSSSRALKFAKLWKEQVLDKSLELAKTYKDPQSTSTPGVATGQVKRDKTEDENLRATFIASNGDDSKSTDSHMGEGEGNKALVLSNVIDQGEFGVDKPKQKKKIEKKVPETCCGRVQENVGNCMQGSCICTLIMTFLACGLCVVPLFFVGRGLCCNCPTCDVDEEDDDDDEKCAADDEKKPEVISESPYKNLKSDLEEVDLKTNV
ncbi:uncharacterized protein LOC143909008 [Arctopsyche grandis]|uniref:uncharacterized protein LOC143909008 n=1 Tax=Arctopsyche grandis TaxID=121162 RepID=UPI00406D796C